jgi:hypothetical protein
MVQKLGQKKWTNLILFEVFQFFFFFFFFFPMSVAVKLATNYRRISRRGTATILLSKRYSKQRNEYFFFFFYKISIATILIFLHKYICLSFENSNVTASFAMSLPNLNWT